jgi:hypothetical protein
LIAIEPSLFFVTSTTLFCLLAGMIRVLLDLIDVAFMPSIYRKPLTMQELFHLFLALDDALYRFFVFS